MFNLNTDTVIVIDAYVYKSMVLKGDFALDSFVSFTYKAPGCFGKEKIF